MHGSTNWQAVSFDWNQVRAFLATAEEGSLSAAARALGLTQPTLSRQVTALEESLGVTLFERGTRVMALTDTGRELIAHVRAMGDAATRLSIAASGQSRSVEGHVRLTATPAFATYHLPRMLSRLRAIAPGISVDIVASNDVRDLTRREADIAVRHGRPSHADLIAKRVGDMSAHLYASAAYLERVGVPRDATECAALDFVGFESAARTVEILGMFGVPIEERSVRVSTESGTVIVALVRQGLGISVMTRDAEKLFPDLRRVLPELAPIPVPIWLSTHRELRTSPRIRVVFDLLAEEIGRGGW